MQAGLVRLGSPGLALLVALLACPSTREQGQPPVRGALGDTVTAAFFPDSVLIGAPARELTASFARALAAMQEPSLAAAPDEEDGSVIRFLWLRTFHRPMAVRLVLRDSSCRVVLTILDSRGPTAPGPIYRRDSSTTTLDRCIEVRSMMDGGRFWNDSLPPAERGPRGAEWVFEARTAWAHRVVPRWSPELTRTDRAFAALGRAFLRIASWDEAADDPIY